MLENNNFSFRNIGKYSYIYLNLENLYISFRNVGKSLWDVIFIAWSAKDFSLWDFLGEAIWRVSTDALAPVYWPISVEDEVHGGGGFIQLAQILSFPALDPLD